MSVDQLQPKSYRSPVEMEFTFPKDLQADTGLLSITIREIPGSAESRAIARAGNDGGVLMQELVKEGIVRVVEVDGGKVVEVSTADDSIDMVLAKLGPKGRALAMQAYHHVNQPNKDQSASFLGSAKVRVQ